MKDMQELSELWMSSCLKEYLSSLTAVGVVVVKARMIFRKKVEQSPGWGKIRFDGFLGRVNPHTLVVAALWTLYVSSLSRIKSGLQLASGRSRYSLISGDGKV